jgi:hypothetical protein
MKLWFESCQSFVGKIKPLKLGMEKGVAFIVDDNSESAHVVRMRTRKSWHGGDEPGALEG